MDLKKHEPSRVPPVCCYTTTAIMETVPALPVAIPARVIKRKRGSAKKAFEAILVGRSVSKRAELCIPKLSFRKLVQEIAQEFKSDLRFQQDGLDALQEAVEMLVIERFKKCSRLAELCRKDTVRGEHWNFVCDEEGGSTLLG